MNQCAALIWSAGLEAVNVLLHPVRALLLHLIGDVAVLIQGERRRVMAQVGLHRLDVVTGTDGRHRV